MSDNNLKTYSDTYYYQKFPVYQKRLLDAIMKDPIIDKNTKEFEDVVYEVKRMKVISDALIKILNSTTVVLLDCNNPLPRTFKVFISKDPKSKDPTVLKVFIDCTNVIEKREKTGSYAIDDIKLLSYLMNAAVCRIYHKNASLILRRTDLIKSATTCFAKLFSSVIDYLIKISIQESKKIKTLYLSSIYFLRGILRMDSSDSVMSLAKSIAGISEREANMIELLLDKICNPNGQSSFNPYDNIKTFVSILPEILGANPNSLVLDIISDTWMRQYGPGTIFALEYFPAFSAMLTDAYNGGYLNQQKTIEKVCGADMVEYSKKIIDLISEVVR